MKKLAALCMSVVVFSSCSSSDGEGGKSDADYERGVVTGMHSSLLTDIVELHQAAVDLQDAAPTPVGRGWDETENADAIGAMTSAWIRARGAYERVEGALAPLFPDIDAAIDARYEDFLEIVGPSGDQNLFDDEGVTGMHAIERILFAKTTPPSVITVEASLPGYKAAAWPATETEASDFKTKLVARLIADTQNLRDQWQPQRIDLGGAFQGLISLMNEQREKVNKAASDEEESRYAQRTMADIRDNLAGTTKIYGLFQPWLETKAGGAAIDADIETAFDALDTAYGAVTGDAIPQPPDTWSSENPSEADLQSPFGLLYSAVQSAVDPNRPGSAVDGMNRAAKELGFPEFAEP